MTPVRRSPKLQVVGLSLAAVLLAGGTAASQGPFALVSDYQQAAESQVATPTLPAPPAGVNPSKVFGRTVIDPNLVPAGHSARKSRRPATTQAKKKEGQASSKASGSRWSLGSWFSRGKSTPSGQTPEGRGAAVARSGRQSYKGSKASSRFDDAGRGRFPNPTVSRSTGGRRSPNETRPAAERQLTRSRTSQGSPRQLPTLAGPSIKKLPVEPAIVVTDLAPRPEPPAGPAPKLARRPAPLPLPLKSIASKRDSIVFVSDDASDQPDAKKPAVVEAGKDAAWKTAMTPPAASAGEKAIVAIKPAPPAGVGGVKKKIGAAAKTGRDVVFVTDNKSAIASAAKKAATSKAVAANQAAIKRGPEAPKPIVVANRTTPTPVPTPIAAKPAPVLAPAPIAAKPAPILVPLDKPDANSKPSKRAVELLALAAGEASKAETIDDFTRVVQRCRHALAIDRSIVVVDYANELASWAINKRGELRADAEQTRDAVSDFNEALRMDKNRWRARHNRGVLHAQSGRYSEAFSDFNEVIRQNPEFAKAYSNRASLHVQSGDHGMALEDYRRAIALDPDLAVAHKGRGRVCHMLGFMNESLQHFDAAVLLAPDDAHIAACRADLLVDNGRYGQAISGYRQAIALDPQLAPAYRNLAWLYATCPEERFRDGEAAVELANRALQMLGALDTEGLDTLAAAHAAAGDFDTAVSVIRKAIAGTSGPEANTYGQRLGLYKRGLPFLSTPVEVVQQANFEK